MVGFAKIGLRSDADTGDSPKSTDDSLTDFLRIPRARSKNGIGARGGAVRGRGGRFVRGRGQGRPAETHGRFLNGFLAGLP